MFTSLQDLVNGTSIRKTYRFLKETEKWPEEQLISYKLNKFRQLLSHAYQNVPYYRDLFDRISFRYADIRNISDIEAIPILTKEMVRQQGDRLLASNYDINSRKIKKGKTGGTTGPPLPVYKDISTRNFTWGAVYRWYDWMGIKSSDKVVVLWGYSKVLSIDHKARLINLTRKYFANTNIINAFNLNDKTIPQIVNEIIKYKPSIIRGYLSAILQIGNYLKNNEINIDGLKAVSTTTETLSPHYRRILQQIYGVPIFDQYGCSECGSIAFECAQHNGLHITEEHVHIEILDSYNKQLVNKPGRIILTDLDNYLMPFIRYENGDMGELTDDHCSCGNNSRLLKSVDGRSIDTVVLKDGSAVHGVFFTDIFYEMKNKEFGNIFRFQVFQKEAGKIKFRIEGRKEIVTKGFLLELQNVLNGFFNVAEIEFLEKLELDKSGKFKYIISELI